MCVGPSTVLASHSRRAIRIRFADNRLCSGLCSVLVAVSPTASLAEAVAVDPVAFGQVSAAVAAGIASAGLAAVIATADFAAVVATADFAALRTDFASPPCMLYSPAVSASLFLSHPLSRWLHSVTWKTCRHYAVRHFLLIRMLLQLPARFVPASARHALHFLHLLYLCPLDGVLLVPAIPAEKSAPVVTVAVVVAPAATTLVAVVKAPVVAVAASVDASSLAAVESLFVVGLSVVVAACAVVPTFVAVAMPVALATSDVVTAASWEGLFPNSCCRDHQPDVFGSVMSIEPGIHGDRLQICYGGRLRFGPDPTFAAARDSATFPALAPCSRVFAAGACSTLLEESCLVDSRLPEFPACSLEVFAGSGMTPRSNGFAC